MVKSNKLAYRYHLVSSWTPHGRLYHDLVVPRCRNDNGRPLTHFVRQDWLSLARCCTPRVVPRPSQQRKHGAAARCLDRKYLACTTSPHRMPGILTTAFYDAYHVPCMRILFWWEEQHKVEKRVWPVATCSKRLTSLMTTLTWYFPEKQQKTILNYRGNTILSTASHTYRSASPG